MQKKKSIHPEKKSTKSTPAHQKKQATEKSTMVLLKALTTIPDDCIQNTTAVCNPRQNSVQ